MVLIKQVSANESKRTCDAKCHTAKHHYCTCICQGKYHGKGKVPGQLDAVIQKYRKEMFGPDPLINGVPVQQTLFE